MMREISITLTLRADLYPIKFSYLNNIDQTCQNCKMDYHCTLPHGAHGAHGGLKEGCGLDFEVQSYKL